MRSAREEESGYFNHAESSDVTFGEKAEVSPLPPPLRKVTGLRIFTTLRLFQSR